MRRDPDTGEALTDYGQPMPSLAEVWDGPPRQVAVCRCGECFVCVWLAGHPDPFGVDEPDAEQLRAEQVAAEDDRTCERYESEPPC